MMMFKLTQIPTQEYERNKKKSVALMSQSRFVHLNVFVFLFLIYIWSSVVTAWKSLVFIFSYFFRQSENYSFLHAWIIKINGTNISHKFVGETKMQSLNDYLSNEKTSTSSSNKIDCNAKQTNEFSFYCCFCREIYLPVRWDTFHCPYPFDKCGFFHLKCCG